MRLGILVLRFVLALALVLAGASGATIGLLVFLVRPDLFIAFCGAVVLLTALLVMTYPVRRATRMAWGAAAAMGVATLLIGPTVYWHARFHIERPCLEALATSDRPDACGANTPMTLRDDTEPQAYAVAWTGVADNWIGPCHAAAGVVRHARWRDEAQPWTPLQEQASQRFGGTITKADRLSGDWYLCWAT